MLSIRSFARSAPRTVARLSSSAIRRPAARPSSLLQAAWKSTRDHQRAAAFSTAAARRSAPAKGDAELTAKLASEIQMENEMKDEGGVPNSVQDYLENGPFEIIDTPGEEDVILTRTFGDEKIRITFSIADLNNLDPEADYQDPAMADEGEDNVKTAPEHQMEEGQEGQDEQDQSFPARLNIIIEKANKGALAVEAVVQDGMVVIDNVYYYADPSLAHAKTAEKVHARQDKYVGPPFGNLDEDLQVLLERYLDERGINTALAIFVPDYIDMKEQKEYVRWLENVKGFVEA
ncbi:glycoprotein suaprga1 [Drepanopeziza brunnea f. sp. 'multigermtubi' MB_m1]|uniref:Glycoprotein suaprga1 n=1 Tax=Marssonina brunnea f. sp. multigermtubi (strain MB_m1) TaxID=1072389 RepID=K1WWJ1_MARBU|nr:glycoprotein suaprga1 [Drepanopeziza brunnea f. sp. 'multigermtubi' MB_m1]EKD16877.1 glycoprotein suaprga1 [Drepanopeziza brunnea f. sp. 'multigermtubi' MB_m1]